MSPIQAIETRDLTRRFGEFTAVDRLNLTVAPGTFFGFLGPNGAGKSTTIKMLTGLLRPTEGRAAVLGHDIEKDSVAAKKRIGVVPDELALFDRLTGPEYLTFVGRMYGMPRPLIRSRADELLHVMDLAGDGRKLIVDYSHGMKKKLALAAALIHEPRVLFLDEPFEAVDVVSSRTIKDILHALIKKDVTIFLTSHILEIVEKLCSHLSIIHHGRLVAQGTLAELRQGVALGGSDHVGADPVGADQGGRTMALEEIFLTLVGAEEGRKTLSWLE